jgi:hypothetical protein
MLGVLWRKGVAVLYLGSRMALLSHEIRLLYRLAKKYCVMSYS